MRQIVDLHIHSRFSRACSANISIKKIDQTCRVKGVDIIASGDFTHPMWFKEIVDNLEETSNNSGLYSLKNSDGKIKFILSTEVSLIYKDLDKVRRVHLMINAPNLIAAKKLNKYLDKHYNIHSDGRPILGVKANNLVSLCLKIDPKFLIYPAHIWTPWFSVFGSKSGFDSLEECFKEEVKHIYAYETGLSSDPAMNSQLSFLDKLTGLSSSDAHSLENIGREANIFDLKELSYLEIYRVIKEKDLKSFKGTIELYPEEGMYYLDGHRNCNFSCLPKETRLLKNICPVCKKPLVIGVLNRIDQLSDRLKNENNKSIPPFYHLVSLDKIIALALGVKSRKSKKVKEIYNFLINNYGQELEILLNLDLKYLNKKIDPKIIKALKLMRSEKLRIKPGFDGLYGEILFN
jgi:uncharacterized protein (TIGR00375 family)